MLWTFVASDLSSMKYFICPLCHEPLFSNSQGLQCASRHQFDRAKEGYFNLLPVHFKHSKEPGDARLQLQARRQFLQTGFFNPLLTAMQGLIPATTNSLLDIGCGEGYFTRGFAQMLGGNAEIYGIDIAKEGVRLAAKAGQGNYAVASSHALPIADKSMEMITRIYAPSKDVELQRIMAPHGQLIIVTPGQQHLLGLRQKIYQTIRPHPQPQAPQGFVKSEQRELTFEFELPAGSLVEALVQMTPFAWRLPRETLLEIMASTWHDTADFTLAVYRRA